MFDTIKSFSISIKTYFNQLLLVIVLFSLPIHSRNIAVLYHPSVSEIQTLVISMQDHFKTMSTDSLIPLSVEKHPKIIKELINKKKIKHVVSIGVKSTKLARQLNLPGIFLMVSYPEKLDLIDDAQVTTTKLYGILHKIPIQKKIELIKKIFPNKTKFGVLYNPEHSQKIIKALTADEHFIVLKEKILDHHHVLDSCLKLKTKINAFLMIEDPTLLNITSFNHMMQFSMLNKIPLIGIKYKMAEKGAVLTIHPNYTELGIMAAKVLHSVVNNQINYKSPLPEFNKISYTVNEHSSNIMNITFSKETVNEAYKII